MVTPRMERIKKILSHLTKGLSEREEIVSVIFLAALSGQNSFLLGRPGTAKSLIARRIYCAFEGSNYFECLMNRFSTPEEIFGPISIKELKEDKYVRKTENYLPKADFAFLDEIWKSGPAILNTLLTLINERIFKNGTVSESAPIKALISASNETPEPNQGLEALYDRFIVRLLVSPIEDTDAFNGLLESSSLTPEVAIDSGLKIKSDEWQEWQKEFHKVKLSKEILTIIDTIRKEVAKKSKKTEKSEIYISDRRWKHASSLLKASAFFCDRDTTNLSDALLLRHCLWDTLKNREKIAEIVEKAIVECGFNTDIDISKLDKDREKLKKDIEENFYYSETKYKTKLSTIDDDECFLVSLRNGGDLSAHLDSYPTDKIYIPIEYMDRKVDGEEVFLQDGEIADYLTCKFDGKKFYIKSSISNESTIFTPEILGQEGDKKTDVTQRIRDKFLDDLSEIEDKYKETKDSVEEQEKKIKKELDIPFVPIEKTNLCYKSITEQKKTLDQSIEHCEELLELITDD